MEKQSEQVHSRESSATLQLTVSLLYHNNQLTRMSEKCMIHFIEQKSSEFFTGAVRASNQI